MLEDSINIEWCIYDVDHHDYSFSLNPETLQQIKNWENFETIMYYNSSNRNSIDKIKEYMKKTLTIWLLSNEERQKIMQECKIDRDYENSKDVSIKISERLLENLIWFDWNHYEHRYDVMWNKMNFFLNNSYYKRELQSNLDFFNQLFDQKFHKE